MKAGEQERGMSFQDEREPLIVHYDIELDDAGLDPYQFRAYQRIARRCAGAKAGQCFESLESMAAGCKMSRPTLVRSIKVLVQRGMIRRLSRQGMTSYYALTDKKNWISLADYEARKERQPGKPQSRVTTEPGQSQSRGVVNHRTTTWSTTEPGGGSVVYTKNTHEENTKENKVRKQSSPSAQRPKNELYEIFSAAYQKKNDCPYLDKQADFVQLAALKKKSLAKNWEITPERFTRAVENYFASEIGTHTLADLATRFSAFYTSKLDRFGQKVTSYGNSNAITSSTIREDFADCGFKAARTI